MGNSGHLERSLESGTKPPGGGSPHIATVNATPHLQKTEFEKKQHLTYICAILQA